MGTHTSMSVRLNPPRRVSAGRRSSNKITRHTTFKPQRRGGLLLEFLEGKSPAAQRFDAKSEFSTLRRGHISIFKRVDRRVFEIEKSHELPQGTSKIEKSKSDKSQVRLKYTMPHTARCCNDPYGSYTVPIFAV